MKILVVGSGGREHALVWKLRQSPLVSAILVAPGNPGMAPLASLIALGPTEVERLAAFAEREGVDLTVIGPEQPLADGIVDVFLRRGLTIFGPTRSAARLESSKAFAKQFMERHRIPTAPFRVFTSAQQQEAQSYVRQSPLPLVLKADGLAAGKGVVVCSQYAQAREELERMFSGAAFGTAGTTVVVEEFLEGVEASVFAVCDGKRYVTLAPAQDHKRIGDHDTGKNTGGMGAYAPAPHVTPDILELVQTEIIEPTLTGMQAEGAPYAGCLYVGLMLTPRGPRVIEFNVRFGDPEAQVVLPLYAGDLAELLMAASTGSIAAQEGGPSPGAHAVCVVLASGGYPDAYRTGVPIVGLERLSGRDDVVVFHAGTRAEGGSIVTAGGRVLGVTAIKSSGTLRETIDTAYAAVRLLSFTDMYARNDIGQKGLLSTAQ